MSEIYKFIRYFAKFNKSYQKKSGVKKNHVIKKSCYVKIRCILIGF